MLPQPQVGELDLVSVLHALSDPIRLEIVRELAHAGDGRPCGSFDVPVTKSTLTHHFRVLREAGMLAQRHDGTTKLCTLRAGDLEMRFPGLLDAVLSATPERPAVAPVAS
ncbi:MAG TPA: helix-turn-helix transcriptional regulator [Thermoleophilaceae bacterium]|nr:helix-turn-helix transcriptional regulator [Thermoleophilaceae bacterium]